MEFGLLKKLQISKLKEYHLSLEKAGYDIPVIGFSWDSNTAFSLDDLSLSKHGWNIAKIIAIFKCTFTR